jgi:hypothetical protein
MSLLRRGSYGDATSATAKEMEMRDVKQNSGGAVGQLQGHVR